MIPFIKRNSYDFLCFNIYIISWNILILSSHVLRNVKVFPIYIHEHSDIKLCQYSQFLTKCFSFVPHKPTPSIINISTNMYVKFLSLFTYSHWVLSRCWRHYQEAHSGCVYCIHFYIPWHHLPFTMYLQLLHMILV